MVAIVAMFPIDVLAIFPVVSFTVICFSHPILIRRLTLANHVSQNWVLFTVDLPI